MTEDNLYKSIFNNANDAIFIHDLQGNLLEVNDTACDRLGYSKEELLRMSLKDIDTPEFAELIKKRIADLKKTGQTIFEMQHRTKKGKVLTIELSLRIIEFKGQPAILSIGRNVTDRKKVEGELKRVYKVIERSLIPMAFTDLRGKITYVNTSFLDMWGYQSKNEVIGRESIDFWEFRGEAAYIINYIRKNGKWSGSLIAKKKDGGLFEAQIYASMVLDTLGKNESMFAWFLDLSEEKKMKRDLVEAEKQYRLLFDTMTQGVVFQNKDGRIIFANLAAEKILGVSKKIMYQRTSHSPHWKTIHEDGTEFLPENHPVKVAIRTEEPVYNTIMGVYHPKKKEYRWININSIPLFRPEEATPYQVYAIFEDITEKKNITDALRASEEKLRGILNNLTEVVAMIDKNYRILWGNQTLNELFGDDLVGKLCHRAFYHTERPCEPCVVQQTFKTEAVHEVEKSAIIQDEKKITLWCTSSIAARDSKGNPNAVIEVCRDITERKEMEKKLRNSEKKYRNLAKLLPDIIFEIDTNFNLTYTNSAGYKIFGYSQEDLERGINVWDLIVRDVDKKKIQERLKRYAKIKNIKPAKYIIRKKDGSEFYAHIHTRPIIKDGKIRGFRGVIININDIILAQRQISFYKDLLAHDIANILNNINLSIELVKSNMEDISIPEEIKPFHKMVKVQVQDGINLISNIQRISRLQKEELKTSEVDAYELLNQIRNNLPFEKDKSILIEIEKPKGVPIVEAGPFLKDVFENIILNAIKHNRSAQKRLKVKIHNNRDQKKNTIRFDFIDNGIGIPDKIKKEIFKREHQSTISSKGMGIGLSLVKMIVKAYNGQIFVKERICGEPTQGSIFSVVLPAA